MIQYRVPTRASVARNFLKYISIKKENKIIQSANSCFSGEEFFRNLLPKKGDSKIKSYRVPTRASVARNFLGIYFLKKGTVK